MSVGVSNKEGRNARMLAQVVLHITASKYRIHGNKGQMATMQKATYLYKYTNKYILAILASSLVHISYVYNWYGSIEIATEQ